MNHDSDMSHESDLRALLPETLSDEAAFALVEALYATVGALESIYRSQEKDFGKARYIRILRKA